MSQHPSALYRALCDLANAFAQRERDLAEHEARIKALEARLDEPYKPPAKPALPAPMLRGLPIKSVGRLMENGTIKLITDPAEIAAIFAKDDA
jgi:hypothetical protein